MTAKPDRAQYPGALPRSFIGTLDGKLLYTVCMGPDGLIQIHRHDALDDANSELLPIEHQLGADLKPLG